MAIFNLNKEAIRLLGDCLAVGFEGRVEEGEHTDAEAQIAALMAELEAIDGSAEITIMATDADLNIDQGGPNDCAIGLHTWVNEVGKLPPETPCGRCGEAYGDPS